MRLCQYLRRMALWFERTSLVAVLVVCAIGCQPRTECVDQTCVRGGDPDAADRFGLISRTRPASTSPNEECHFWRRQSDRHAKDAPLLEFLDRARAEACQRDTASLQAGIQERDEIARDAGRRRRSSGSRRSTARARRAPRSRRARRCTGQAVCSWKSRTRHPLGQGFPPPSSAEPGKLLLSFPTRPERPAPRQTEAD